MSLVNSTDFPINPTTTSGTQLADILNRLFNAYESNQSNATRPPELTAGGIWTKIDGSTMRLMFYDGAVDIEIVSFNAGAATLAGAGVGSLAQGFNPAKTYKAGDVIYDATSKTFQIAKTDLAAGPYNAGSWTITNDPFNQIKGTSYSKAEIDAMFTAKLAAYLPLTGGALTGPLTSTSTIATDGAISSKADITAFKP